MTPELTLGPLLFLWRGEDVRDFYFRIADEAPVDRVCLGEIVCPKRLPLVAEHLPAIAERLARAGKRIVHATPILIADDRELDRVRALLAQVGTAADDALIEANDVAALSLLAGRPHAIGPTVNVYNEATLAVLARAGATRVCLPVELTAAAIAAIAASAAPVTVEVHAYGRWPLAISARCYHARAYGRHKDGCGFACGEDPDGLPVTTLDDQDFVSINGVQTMSYAYGCLTGELAGLVAAGVGAFRLSPQRVDMVAVARLYRDLLDGRLDGDEARARLADLAPAVPLANGFVHAREGVALVEGAA